MKKTISAIRKVAVAGVVAGAFLGFTPKASACTGISLKSADNAVIVGRTVEWALSDAQHNQIMIFPKNKFFVAQTPQGNNGMKWTGLYGFVSMTAYGQPYGPDGMNEVGLYVGMYYLPGFAEYLPYDPAQVNRTLSVGDFMQWMLASFKTVEDVRAALNTVRVVNVDDPKFGGAALPFHWKIADPTGASIVLELVESGQMKVYDAFMGVITNAPTYDWHLTNLRNYLHLSPSPSTPLTLDSVALSPLGAGSGMMGLPGDFSPPSRFIRAAAFTASVRPLATAADAVFEAFRILDSFNIPLGTVAPTEKIAGDIESSTQITSVCDLKNRVFYYHTMFNRQVRKIDLNKINFAKVKQQIIDDDTDRKHIVRELIPKK